ncbi:MAG: Gar1/Naf1 family protein [Candidatus Thermoplasmatota archaeon]|nr:Gar1/Naf1 family protein [Candidatus Thermoplasmatota archaeon]
MRSLGRVVNFSPKGSLILRCENAPSIGSMVVDRRGGAVGKIVRVTGPVDAPFAMVRPFEKSRGMLSKMSGKELFLGNAPPSRRHGDDRKRESHHPRGSGKRAGVRSGNHYPSRQHTRAPPKKNGQGKHGRT